MIYDTTFRPGASNTAIAELTTLTPVDPGSSEPKPIAEIAISASRTTTAELLLDAGAFPVTRSAKALIGKEV